jgi:hypothetical protein
VAMQAAHSDEIEEKLCYARTKNREYLLFHSNGEDLFAVNFSFNAQRRPKV